MLPIAAPLGMGKFSMHTSMGAAAYEYKPQAPLTHHTHSRGDQ